MDDNVEGQLNRRGVQLVFGLMRSLCKVWGSEHALLIRFVAPYTPPRSIHRRAARSLS
jgi:hypothetical protein